MATVLKGRHVTVSVSEVVFNSFEVGVRYVVSIVVHNTSMRGQRIRFVPPRASVFSLNLQNDVEIAAGLDLHAELFFESSEYKDYEDKIIISVGRVDGLSEELTIPIRATQPAANFAFETLLDFGALGTKSRLLPFVTSLPGTRFMVASSAFRQGAPHNLLT